MEIFVLVSLYFKKIRIERKINAFRAFHERFNDVGEQYSDSITTPDDT